MMIVIDYDAGNTANVLRALNKIGVRAKLSDQAQDVLTADGLILPGVGAYRSAMNELAQRGLIEPIKEAVLAGKPLLGICLGMQILTDWGLEDGETKGLGLIPGTCRKIPSQPGLPVPHMGWNNLKLAQTSALTADLADQTVYFVHSYFTDVPPEYIDLTADYGLDLPAMIHKDHIFGCQFHPEKSGQVGLGILEKFKEYVYENSTRY